MAQALELPAVLPKGITQYKDGFRVSKSKDGVRLWKNVDTFEEAEIQLKIITKQLNKQSADKAKSDKSSKPKPGRVVTQSMTLEKAYYRTLESVWKGTKAEVTAKKNASKVLAYFGRNTAVEKIDLDWIDSWVESMWQAGNTGSTINRKLSCLSRILRTAHERDRLFRLPKMPRQRENQNRIRVLSEEEETELLNYFQHMGYVDHWDAAMILLYTGFRPGELWRLTCADVDMKHNTVTAWVTKTDRPRTIPIVAKIRPVFEQRLEKVGGKGLVFPGSSSSWFLSGWDKAREEMGFWDDPQFIPYVLRHTCASRLAKKGVSMMLIKEWMGHSTIQTTARYVHFAPKDLIGAAASLDNF